MKPNMLRWLRWIVPVVALAALCLPATAQASPATPASHARTLSCVTGEGCQWQMYNNQGWCIADPSAGGSGTAVVEWGCQDHYWFEWAAIPVTPNGAYELVVNGLCLTDPNLDDNVRLTVTTCDNGNDQVWSPYALGGGDVSWYEPWTNAPETVTDDFGTLKDGAWVVAQPSLLDNAQQTTGIRY